MVSQEFVKVGNWKYNPAKGTVLPSITENGQLLSEIKNRTFASRCKILKIL